MKSVFACCDRIADDTEDESEETEELQDQKYELRLMICSYETDL